MVKNVFNLVIEGPDGVGKSTLIGNIFKRYNYMYMCYHRGELSNFVFAKKYGRQFFATQNRLPFLYIYLYCSKDELRNRIEQRSKLEHWSKSDTDDELQKVEDVDLFEQAYEDMKTDYDIIRINTTGLSETETMNKVANYLDHRNDSLKEDDSLTSWNKMYAKTCDKLGISFKVFDNQPYIDGRPVMVESTLHNGEYETYADKKCYDNTLYAMAYGKVTLQEKVYDFNYIINSKIKRRKEVFDYYDAFEKAHLTCQVSGRNNLIKESEYLIKQKDFTGDDYLSNISKSKATVYCARDLAYLELQTARLYESILAKNIVFVDEETDRENKILKQIYPDDSRMQKLLRVNPSTIVAAYKSLNSTDINYIINMQDKFWEKTKSAAIDFYKKEKVHG